MFSTLTVILTERHDKYIHSIMKEYVILFCYLKL